MTYVSPMELRNSGPDRRTPDQKAHAAEVAERIGDGSQLNAEHFKLLNIAERTALFRANPDRYRALRDGITPGEAWTPGAGR